MMRVLPFFLMVSVSAGAEPVGLGELVTSVRRFSPVLDAVRTEVRAAEAASTIAEGAFDPAVRGRSAWTAAGDYPSVVADLGVEKPLGPLGSQLFAGWRLGRGEFASYDGKAVTNEFGELRAGVQASLWRNRDTDRRRTSEAQAQAGVESARALAAVTLLDTSRVAAARYWEWAAANERLTIAKGLLAVALTRDGFIAARVEKGELPPIERTDSRRTIEQRQAQVVQATRGLEQGALELSMFLRDAEGRPVIAEATRVPSLAVVDAGTDDVTKLLACARALRPELRRLELQRGQAEAERAFADNQSGATVDVGLAVRQDLGTALDGDPKRGKTGVEASVAIDLPTQRRQIPGRIEAAIATLGRIDAQVRLLNDRIGVDVRDAGSALRAAKLRVDAADRELGYAREVEAAERTRFDLGDSTLFTVNLREQQTAETALRRIDAQLDVARSIVARRAAIGLLPDGTPADDNVTDPGRAACP